MGIYQIVNDRLQLTPDSLPHTTKPCERCLQLWQEEFYNGEATKRECSGSSEPNFYSPFLHVYKTRDLDDFSHHNISFQSYYNDHSLIITKITILGMNPKTSILPILKVSGNRMNFRKETNCETVFVWEGPIITYYNHIEVLGDLCDCTIEVEGIRTSEDLRSTKLFVDWENKTYYNKNGVLVVDEKQCIGNIPKLYEN